MPLCVIVPDFLISAAGTSAFQCVSVTATASGSVFQQTQQGIKNKVYYVYLGNIDNMFHVWPLQIIC